MTTDIEFVDYIIEQVALGPRLEHRRMFGEYALYLDGKVFAFVCDNSLFLKPTSAVEALAPDLPRRPPYAGAKPYPVADELLDDGDGLRTIVLRSVELLPAPRPKKKVAGLQDAREFGSTGPPAGKPARKKS